MQKSKLLSHVVSNKVSEKNPEKVFVVFDALNSQSKARISNELGMHGITGIVLRNWVNFCPMKFANTPKTGKNRHANRKFLLHNLLEW